MGALLTILAVVALAGWLVAGTQYRLTKSMRKTNVELLNRIAEMDAQLKQHRGGEP